MFQLQTKNTLPGMTLTDAACKLRSTHCCCCTMSEAKVIVFVATLSFHEAQDFAVLYALNFHACRRL